LTFVDSDEPAIFKFTCSRGYFDGFLDVSEAMLFVGEHEYMNSPVVGVPIRWAIIGRKIIKRFKWEID
jgi:hypothetical protein